MVDFASAEIHVFRQNYVNARPVDQDFSHAVRRAGEVRGLFSSFRFSFFLAGAGVRKMYGSDTKHDGSHTGSDPVLFRYIPPAEISCGSEVTIPMIRSGTWTVFCREENWNQCQNRGAGADSG